MLGCTNCEVKFSDAAQHKLHFRSEWHRYNLKRKVADLPSVSLVEFDEKCETFGLIDKNSPAEDDKLSCQLCGRSFKTEKAMENHWNSKKHARDRKKMEQEALLKAHEENDEMNIDEEDHLEWETDSEDSLGSAADYIDGFHCFYCDEDEGVNNLQTLLSHMQLEHAFYIPDADKLKKPTALYECLKKLYFIERMCVWCSVEQESKRVFSSIAALRHHMGDKGHTMFQFHSPPYLSQDNAALNQTLLSFYSANDGDKVDVDVATDGYSLSIDGGKKLLGNRAFQRYFKQNMLRNYAGNIGASRRQMALGNASSSAALVAKNFHQMDRTTRNQIVQGKVRTAADLRRWTKAQTYHPRSVRERFHQQRRLKLDMQQNKLPSHIKSQIDWAT